MRRKDLMDTSPEAYRRYIELVRKLTPTQRIARQMELIELARQMTAVREKRKRQP